MSLSPISLSSLTRPSLVFHPALSGLSPIFLLFVSLHCLLAISHPSPSPAAVSPLSLWFVFLRNYRQRHGLFYSSCHRKGSLVFNRDAVCLCHVHKYSSKEQFCLVFWASLPELFFKREKSPCRANSSQAEKRRRKELGLNRAPSLNSSAHLAAWKGTSNPAIYLCSKPAGKKQRTRMPSFKKKDTLNECSLFTQFVRRQQWEQLYLYSIFHLFQMQLKVHRKNKLKEKRTIKRADITWLRDIGKWNPYNNYSYF